MAGENEIDLVTRAAAGETEAFRKLFEAHHAAMFRLAYRLTNTVDAAEDITQECFLRLIRSPGFDCERGGLRQYLFGIVRNLVRQRRYASGREVPWDDEAEDDPVAAITAHPAPPGSSETSHVVQAAIAMLPPLQREVVVLFELEELTLEETAAVVGAEVGAVKSRLYRARERLRRSLAPYRSHSGRPSEEGVDV